VDLAAEIDGGRLGEEAQGDFALRHVLLSFLCSVSHRDKSVRGGR
jgi:hypothetical protein